MINHKIFIDRCLELADIAAKEGESAVGSIVVKGGLIIGEGYEKSRQLGDVTRHAEVVAILDALKKDKDLSGAVLYTNVEPCILCSYVIRHHKISEVVFVEYAGELGGVNPPFNLLTSDSFKSWVSPPRVTLFRGE